MDPNTVDPFLSSAVLEGDLSLCPSPNFFDLEEVNMKEESSPDVDQEEDDEIDLSYPTQIHSYCQLTNMQPRSTDSLSKLEMVQPRSQKNRRRRQRRPGRRVTQDSSLDEDKAIFSNGKLKLYSQKPFKNPRLEKARLNALNAKLNRERKKQECENLRQDLEKLRRENEALKKSHESLESRASRAEEDLGRLKEVLEQANLTQVLKFVSDPEE